MSVSPRREAQPMDRHRYVADDGLEYCHECGQDANAPIHGQPVEPYVEITAILFADFARKLGAVCHDLALRVPAFRGMPVPDEDGDVRWIRRYPNGSVTVSVVLRNRPASAVKRDMVDGACEANGLHHDHPKRWMLHDRMEDA